MIFRSGVFSKRSGLSAEHFTKHWTEVHGALAKQLPGLHTYLQNHIDERFFERSPFPSHPVDGISQLWFDDIAAMEIAERSAQYEKCKKDIPNFQGEITILVLDAAFPGMTTPADPRETHAQLDASVKLLWFATSRNKVGPKQLRADLNREDASLTLSSIPGAVRVVLDSVVDRGHPVAAGVPQGEMPADVLGEIWFESAAALTGWVGSIEGQKTLFRHPTLDPLAVYRVDEVRIL
jgi:uncharacterized protein (TIGR02118 family)